MRNTLPQSPGIFRRFQSTAINAFLPLGRQSDALLSEWERLELNLARLYGALLGIPPINAIAESEYVSATISRSRIDVIERAAGRFFCRHCDQELEGDFAKLIDEIRQLAMRRNDIAHGVVNLIWHAGNELPETAREALDHGLLRKEYMLTPATYKAKLFGEADRKPAYLFNAKMIRGFSGRFESYRFEVEQLLVRVLQKRHSVEEASQRTGDPPMP